MADYNIEWKNSALKELDALPNREIARILSTIETLVTNPYPDGSIKLAGANNRYRIRVGDYRIIYTIENQKLIIMVIKIGHRREVYR